MGRHTRCCVVPFASDIDKYNAIKDWNKAYEAREEEQTPVSMAGWFFDENVDEYSTSSQRVYVDSLIKDDKRVFIVNEAEYDDDEYITAFSDNKDHLLEFLKDQNITSTIENNIAVQQTL